MTRYNEQNFADAEFHNVYVDCKENENLMNKLLVNKNFKYLWRVKIEVQPNPNLPDGETQVFTINGIDYPRNSYSTILLDNVLIKTFTVKNVRNFAIDYCL